MDTRGIFLELNMASGRSTLHGLTCKIDFAGCSELPCLFSKIFEQYQYWSLSDCLYFPQVYYYAPECTPAREATLTAVL